MLAWRVPAAVLPDRPAWIDNRATLPHRHYKGLVRKRINRSYLVCAASGGEGPVRRHRDAYEAGGCEKAVNPM
jgi:hypothetical protein